MDYINQSYCIWISILIAGTVTGRMGYNSIVTPQISRGGMV